MSMIEWLHATSYAVQVRESQFLYPLLQAVHIIGIGLFIGGLTLTNLRVAGVGCRIPLVDMARHAMRAAWVGLFLIIATGLQMLLGFIDVFSVSGVFGIKLMLVLGAIANAAFIQQGIGGPAPRWLGTPPDVRRARLWATAAITMLAVIIILGKLLAYIGGKD